MADERVKRKLTAVLSADVKGYSRLMGQDELATVETLKKYREIMATLIERFQGRVVDSPGDNVLAEFSSAVDAVDCAIEIQKEMKQRNAELPENRRMEFRIGVNLGDVIADGERIYGDGVNIVARVESLAEGGGICISGTVYDQVENKLRVEYEYLGAKEVKNIAKPVRVYRVVSEPIDALSGAGRTLELPEKPSIAVLPFVNMSGDPEQDYFSDGITEDIITALSRSALLFVIARNSTFSYRGKPMDVRRVSKELGVRYILEGSVRKSGNRLRVTAQLVDGITGNHVFAEKYDGDLENIFELQDQITQQVVASIPWQIQLDISEKLNRLDRPDLRTWDLLARGIKLFSEATKESLPAAETIFRTALGSAPSSCDAHWLLAGVLIHQAFMGYASDKKATSSEAYELAKKAIALEDRNEYAHWVMGLIDLYRGNHHKAIAEYQRAIELNPNLSLAYGSLGTAFNYTGESDESLRNNEIAIRSNPRDVSIAFRFTSVALAHYLAGRYAEAEEWARKAVYRKPNWYMGHTMLAASLAQLDRLKEAKEAVATYLQIFPDAKISALKEHPFKNPSDVLRLEEGLRKAGLPE
jgi:adenylate cyclase